MNKAIFLDRDGTINYDFDHVFQVERIQLLTGVSKAIGDLKRAGYLIIIISNQSCIGRGYATQDQVIACMERVSELLKEEDTNALIEKAYFAPELPEIPNNTRKPKPDMILDAIKTYNLDPLGCWMIGDRMSDPMAGYNAGLKPANCILLEPNGIKDTLPLTEVEKAIKMGFKLFNNLSDATHAILNA